ncbi:MAG: hypothetical protein LBO08_01310 [Rickettsiales bacterium]|jgi:hypothetical protein|nr:hypothetical protein [Rickettsiales bacterium]
MGTIVNDIQEIITNKKANNATKAEKSKILAQIAEDEKAKANLVKKALAAQRAKYGASGASGRSMSDEAVLKRLRDETEEPFQSKRLANMEKISKLKTKKPNLLKSFIAKFESLLA